jgi:signal transduction histidine kinase
VRRYDVELLEGEKPIYIKPGAQKQTETEWTQDADLKLYGVVWGASSWKIRVWPTPWWLNEMHSPLDEVVLVTGLFLTGLLALLAHFFQLVRTRARQLERANAALEKEINERERAQTALADFTAMIVHDLRSPLSNVISIVTMMKEGLFGSVNPEQETWLKKAEKVSRGCVELIGDALDVSKLESGHIELRKETTDLQQLVKSVVDNYSVAAEDKRIRLIYETDHSLPHIRADPGRLEQVLNNLLSNALKFTPEAGQIVVGATCNRKEIEISVKDNGVGIVAEEMGQLFEKYKQTASGEASEYKGTGLGLVICKMIVEAHGGKIRAESKEGKGTTFTFTLPVGA